MTPTRFQSRDFWGTENVKYRRPHYRLVKSARIINGMAASGRYQLLDVGCGPAALRRLLRPNIEYHGIDIAITEPGPNLLERDLLAEPISFEGRRFDIVVAQGLFEYLGHFQDQKLRELASILEPNGTLLVSYVNFGHRVPLHYGPYNNVRPFDRFLASLAAELVVRRVIPTSHNWHHSEPARWWLKELNLRIDTRIPVVSRRLAVEYFCLCSPRWSRSP